MTPSPAAEAPLLSVEGVTKDFPGVRALDGVSFSLAAGEIHAIVGENGAGKSTLIRIIGGIWPAGMYEGKLSVGGGPARFASPRAALNSGVAVIHQELELIPDMTAAENIVLGDEPARLGWIDRAEARRRAARVLAELGVDIRPDALVRDCGMGERQMIEIAKALSRNFRILILDEPTASLSAGESEALFRLLEKLKTRGVGIIYISHRLKEVARIADAVTVLRDGKVVARFARGGADEKTLIRAMVGRDIERAFPERPRRSGAGEEKLRVENLSYARAGRAAGPISFTVREGEILGIAGLVGAGRTELLEAIFGLRHKNSGRVWIEGWETEIRDARAAVRAGLAFVSEDRKGTGLVLDESVRSNVTLASLERFSKAGWVDRPREREAAREFTGKLRIKTPGIETPAGALSGGNQQKIVLAKWLLCRPKVLLCDEPTRGIDVGAKAEIYSLLRGLADGGMAVVLVSSELPEILGLSDRILVLSDGKAAGTFPAEGTSEETLLEAMTSAFR